MGYLVDHWVASAVDVLAHTGIHGVPDPLSVLWLRHSNDPVIGYVDSASRGWLWLPFEGGGSEASESILQSVGIRPICPVRCSGQLGD